MHTAWNVIMTGAYARSPSFLSFFPFAAGVCFGSLVLYSNSTHVWFCRGEGTLAKKTWSVPRV